MTRLPQELILAVFDMFTNVNDIINYAESNKYVFNIYKAYIDKIVTQLIKNNKKNIIYFVILGAYGNKYYDKSVYSIDTKVDIMKKIGNYLANITNTKLQQPLQLFEYYKSNYNTEAFSIRILLANFYYLQITKGYDTNIAHIASYLTLDKYNKFIHYVNLGNNYMECYRMIRKLDEHQIELMQTYIDRGLSFTDAESVAAYVSESNVDKVFELYEQYSISIINAIEMINEFTQLQIEKTQQLINDGIDSDIAFRLVEKFNEVEIELCIKLYKMITEKNYILELICETHRTETELNTMIKLLQNNFDENQIIYITNELVMFDDFDDSYIMQCIELKNKGIRDNHILLLLENNICKNFDFEYYDSLIQNNHSSESAIDMIINGHRS